MPSLLPFLFPFLFTYLPLSPISLSLLRAPPLCPLTLWDRVMCPISLWAWQSCGLPCFLHRQSHLPARSRSSVSCWTEQRVGTGSEIQFLLYKIRAWGNIMIAGGFSENCFGMIWFNSPSSSHHLPLNMLVHTPGRFESISKHQSQLTWGGRAYPLETLQMCN